MKKIVDPASGWMYGFPAVWDEENETIEELYDRHNYPENLRGLWVRMWWADDDDDTYEDKNDESTS